MTSMEPAGPAVVLVRLANPAGVLSRHPNAPLPPYGLKYLQAVLLQSGKRVILRDGLVESGASERAHLELLLARDRIDAVVFDAPLGTGATAKVLARVCRAAGIDALYLAGCDPEVTGEVGKVVAPFHSVVGVELDLALADELCGLKPTMRDLPVPRYTPEEIRRYRQKYPVRLAHRVRYGHVLASRGCPHRCAFCTQVLRATAGARVRTRDVDSVVEEIGCRRREGANVILFGDDDLTADRSFVAELAGRLARARAPIPFVAHARVDELDRAQIDRLSRGGCELLLFGIESAVPSVLRTLGKTPRPRSWSDKAVEIFARCREAGIRTHAMFILGTPGESAADIQESLRLVRRLAPDSVQIHFFTPYPGVVMPDRGETRRPRHHLAHYEEPGDVPEGPSGAALLAWRDRFYRTLYTDRRWWRKQLRELAPFLAFNPDVALTLLDGVYRLSNLRGGGSPRARLDFELPAQGSGRQGQSRLEAKRNP